jgi:hypothetical protein
MGSFIAGVLATLALQRLWARFGHEIVAEGWQDSGGFHYGRPDELTRARLRAIDEYEAELAESRGPIHHQQGA